jgi:hypothetical protein
MKETLEISRVSKGFTAELELTFRSHTAEFWLSLLISDHYIGFNNLDISLSI